jgi:uncharacterized membrane protein YvbJ
MFCPNCGTSNLTEQKFCRSCGLNLEKSVESLLAQLPSVQNANLLKKEKLVERFGYFALSGLGIVTLIAFTALLYTLVSKFIVTGTNIFAAILLITFMIFAFLSLVFVIFNESLKEKKAKTNPALNKHLNDKKDTTKFLEEKHFEPVSSVTENSTELLFVESKIQNR